MILNPEQIIALARTAREVREELEMEYDPDTAVSDRDHRAQGIHRAMEALRAVEHILAKEAGLRMVEA